MTTRYQELENQVKEIQKEIDRLKKEERESKLPEDFNRGRVINFLKNPNKHDLKCAFIWRPTPQGHDYWFYIYNCLCHSRYKVPKKAIIQLQNWVIQSYQEQYGV